MISVVIPALDAEPYLRTLLDSIERQTLLPGEIVIVDSSRDRKSESLLQEWQGPVPIVYHRVDFAYPGHARNLGVALARHDWIAFLDCRTIPSSHWLEEGSRIAGREGSDYVGAQLECSAETFFKKALLAATYGKEKVRTLPGSLVRKEVFAKVGGFLAEARAGEDIEWMARVAAAGTRMSVMESTVARYEGFPSTLRSTIRKWHLYTVANARINVRTTQKVMYISVFLASTVLLAYKWNYLFAHWREDSLLYIPNITKLFVGSLAAGYLLYRGLLRPAGRGVSLSYLLPWRWLAVFFIGLCIDLAKAPGMIMGAVILLEQRLRLVLCAQGVKDS